MIAPEARTDASGAALAPLASPTKGRMYEGRVARVHPPGDPLKYSWGNEHRDAAELAKIVSQLPGKPVVTHPESVAKHPDDLIRAGAAHVVVGRIESARVDGDHAVARVFITDGNPDAQGMDTATIRAIEDGVHELSLGYACRADDKGFQTGTYVDHLALVPMARCGKSCALRADGAGCECQDTDTGMRTSRQGACTCSTSANALHNQVTTPAAPEKRDDSKLNAAARHALPAHSFGIPGREGLPLEDAGHVRDAMARFGQEQFKDSAERKAAYHRVLARAHELGIDSTHFQAEHGRMDSTTPALTPSPAPVKDNVMDELQKQLAQTQAALTAAQTRADGLERELGEAKKAKETAELAQREAQKDANAEKARADAADVKAKAAEQKGRQDAATEMTARVNARVDILKSADAVMGAADKDGKAIDRSSTSDVDLMKQICKHVDGDDAVLDTDSDDAIRVSYRGAMKRNAKSDTSREIAAITIHQGRQAAVSRQDGDDSEASAYASMTADYARPAKKNR